MKITKSKLREIIREEIKFIREASLNPVVDKLIKSGNKKRIKIELDHFKRVSQDKLFDKVVNPKAVKYSIDALERALKESVNEARTPRKALDANKVKNPDDFWKVSINKINKASGTSFGRQREVGDVILWLNFAIDAWNKGRVRESVNEGGMGILDKDQTDVLHGIVLKNKNKTSKAILNIVMKDPMFKKEDKKEMLGYIEGAKQFVKYMKSHPINAIKEISGIDLAKKVVKNKQHEKGMDLFTASYIVQTYDAYKNHPNLRKKIEKLSVPKAIKLANLVMKGR